MNNNKLEIQKQIDEIDSTLKELQEKQNKLKELLNQPEDVRWRAELYGWYLSVDTEGDIITTQDTRGELDNFRYLTGNYFKTKEEAEAYKENLLNKQKLKDTALRLNNGHDIHWDVMTQPKHYIYYDYSLNTLAVGLCSTVKISGQVYCLNDNFLQVAEKEIGEESLIKLIKSGV